LIAVGVLSFNAYANFSATQSYNQTIGSGTMTLALANETSATIAYNLAGSAIAPGDTMQRSLLLTVGGTVATASLSLTATATTSTALDTDATNGLTFKVESCSQKWDETVSGGIPTYACDTGGGATQATVVASEPVATLIATGHTGGGALTTGLTLGGANHLKVTWGLPAGTGNTFQNLSSVVAVTFTTNQRAATNK
jgi:hypothetical protein